MVDNAPPPMRRRGWSGTRPAVRYVREPRPGLDWARNRAIAEATGEILAFTDDDVVVDAGWVRALAAVFRDDPASPRSPDSSLPVELDTDAQLLFERTASFARGFAAPARRGRARTRGAVAAPLRRHRPFGTGANMAFRRERVRPGRAFDPALGAGTPARGGDDLEMFFRVLKARPRAGV